MDGMTIDEVIKYFDDDAKENAKLAIIYRGNDNDLAEMHKQDAIRSSYVSVWLRELKDYKDERVGCEYCKHNFREQHERPCSLCQRNFMDMFEREDEDEKM